MTPKFDNLARLLMEGPDRAHGGIRKAAAARTGDWRNRMGTSWMLSSDGVQAYNDIRKDVELRSYLLAAAEAEKEAEALARGKSQIRGRSISINGALARVLIDFAVLRQDEFREFLPQVLPGINQPGTKFTVVDSNQPAVGQERREIVDRWLQQYAGDLPSSGAMLDVLLQFAWVLSNEFKRMMEEKYRVTPIPKYIPPDIAGPEILRTPLDQR